MNAAVGEGEAGADFADGFKIVVVRDAAEGDDGAQVAEEFEFAFEEGTAGADFRGERLVVRWRAAGGGGDVGSLEGKSVVAAPAFRLGGEAGVVKRGVEKVAGLVAGEHAAGAVGSVSAGGEADDEKAGVRIAESGDRFTPIVFVAVGAPFRFRNGGAVCAEARTEAAVDDVLVQDLEEVWRGHSVAA